MPIMEYRCGVKNGRVYHFLESWYASWGGYTHLSASRLLGCGFWEVRCGKRIVVYHGLGLAGTRAPGASMALNGKVKDIAVGGRIMGQSAYRSIWNPYGNPKRSPGDWGKRASDTFISAGSEVLDIYRL